MKRRTFLQLIGLTAAPIPPLVGADLGKALTKPEDVGSTALLRVITSVKPFYFKIPVKYEYAPDGGLHCYPRERKITMEVSEDMFLEKIETRSHPDLAKFYKSIGVDRQWINLPISRQPLYAKDNLTIELSPQGLYSITS